MGELERVVGALSVTSPVVSGFSTHKMKGSNWSIS